MVMNKNKVNKKLSVIVNKLDQSRPSKRTTVIDRDLGTNGTSPCRIRSYVYTSLHSITGPNAAIRHQRGREAGFKYRSIHSLRMSSKSRD